MAAKKTENGVAFPAEAFLVSPDLEVPSGWKLRIWDLDKKVTVPQLGRAAAALGPGFRGQRVQLTTDQRQAAISKLRSLYRAQDVKADDFPPVLQAAAHRVAQERMHRNFRRVMEAFKDAAPEGLAEVFTELREDGAVLDEHYHGGLSAMQEGTLSFEGVLHAVEHALAAYHASLHPNQMPGGMYDCAGLRAIATFPEVVIYDHYGTLWQVSYRMAGTAAHLGDDHVEVTAEFVPVETGEARVAAEAGEQGRKPRDLHEATPATWLREAQLDRDRRVIAGTVLITAESVNGEHGKRRYAEKALRQIAQMAEGLPAFANHVPKDQAFKPRDVKDLIGRHKGVRYDAGRQRVVSDLHVMEHQADWVFALAEDLADVVGNSLVSRGLVRMEGDTEIVEEILAVRSGDLVSDPGATRGLFEHRETWTGQQQHTGRGGENMPPETKVMTLDEVRTYLAAHPAEAMTVLKELHEQDAKATAQDREFAAMKAEHAKLKTDLAEVRAKNDAHEAAKQAREKAARLEAKLAGSDLVKRFGKVAPGAVSEKFTALLLEADEQTWDALIADRATVIEEAVAAAPGGPKSAFKPVETGGNGDLPAGVHARAYAALI